jgi:hypothetical protein
MSSNRTLPFPVWMMALDVIGTVLVGLGLFGLFGGLAPEAVSAADFESASIAFIVFGAVLMLPLLVTLIRRALSGNRAD